VILIFKRTFNNTVYKASNRITFDSQQFTFQRKIEDVAKKGSTPKECCLDLSVSKALN